MKESLQEKQSQILDEIARLQSEIQVLSCPVALNNQIAIPALPWEKLKRAGKAYDKRQKLFEELNSLDPNDFN